MALETFGIQVGWNANGFVGDDGGAREWFGNEESIPASHSPTVFGERADGDDGDAKTRSQVDRAVLASSAGSAGPVDGEGDAEVVDSAGGAKDLAQSGCSTAAGRAADGSESEGGADSGDDLAVTALTDEGVEATRAEEPDGEDQGVVPAGDNTRSIGRPSAGRAAEDLVATAQGCEPGADEWAGEKADREEAERLQESCPA